MAERLLECGYRVSVYDTNASRVTALEALGAVGCSSAASAAEGANAILVAVADSEQLMAVLLGDAGAASSMSEGMAVVVTSTVGIDVIDGLAAELATSNLAIVDSPVSGGPSRALDGTLVAMVGADDHAYELVEPVLVDLTSRIVRCGGPGAGQAVKLVNQLLAGVHAAAAAEAVELAERLGLDGRTVLAAVSEGAASSFMLRERGDRLVSRVDLPARTRLDIFYKDMELVAAAANRANFAAPLAMTARRLYARAHEAGLGDHDDTAVRRVLGQVDV